jgi:hypothetical protein
VIRERRDGKPDDLEVHLGLDFARVAALGYALAGRTGPYTSRVRIRQVWLLDSKRGPEVDIDDIDERVASIFLYGVSLPKAWSESDGLALLG